jgi:hypothetical protein
MNITPMLVGVAFAMFVLFNVAAVYRVHLRHRRVRSALDLPRRMGRPTALCKWSGPWKCLRRPMPSCASLCAT